MPPLDVLMGWHAHMLNPRAFLEDCIRYGKMYLWTSGFPWEVIDSCIDNQTFTYTADRVAMRLFERKTELEWNNLHDSPNKLVACPNCEGSISVPWSAGQIGRWLHQIFESFHGFADKNFKATCFQCQFQVNHERLKIAKFRKDVRALLEEKLPMPGTFYNLRGVPEVTQESARSSLLPFPNRFLLAAGRHILDFTDPQLDRCKNMTALRDEFERKFQDRKIMHQANCDTSTRKIIIPQPSKVAFRQMMSRYWENTSSLAIDLIGAVIRQGSFIQKMDNVEWLHSPGLKSTMNRLIKKYSIFFEVMTSNPRHMAVPTLDVDLAWHTHQLSPYRYFQYSMHSWRKGYPPIFIDHDDKVEEVKLSDAFEWTSKTYRKITGGAIYSECTCWYCEATRASDLDSSSNTFLVTTTTTRARANAVALHHRPDISSNPEKNAHISAHSAIRVKPPAPPYEDPRRMKAL